MRSNPFLRDVLDDDALTRGLGDPEARVLVEWLVEETERLVERVPTETAAREVRRLCRHGRAVACFVRLWSIEHAWGPALQLAATQRFPWPLPDTALDPCELMQEIVFWETQQAQPDASSP
jgi:hypothetical protein